MENDKLIAIISYLFGIGLIVAIIMHLTNKTKLGGFHVRQSLLLTLLGMLTAYVPLIGWLISIVLFVFWIMGLVDACKGKMTPVPLVGVYAQEWFKGL